MPSSRAVILQCLEGRAADSTAALALAEPLDRLLGSPTLAGRIDAWIDVADWSREGGGKVWRERGKWPARWERLNFFIQVLETDAGLRTAHQEAILSIIEQAEAVGFFAESGMPADRGTLPEIWDSLMKLLLPQPREDQKLSTLLQRQFRNIRQVARFHQTPDELFFRLAHVMFPLDQPERFAPLRRSFADAFRVLGARVQAQFFAEALRTRMTPAAIKDTAAHRLAHMTERLADEWLVHAEIGEITEAWDRTAHDADHAISQVIQSMEQEGVSVDLVHNIETIRVCLGRMRLMRHIMGAPDRAGRLQAVQSLLGQLIRAVKLERNPLHILSSRTALLHRKIVERSGETGTHYIAQDASGYRHIWAAAAGGGLLTVGTAAVKLQIHEWHGLPLFIEGLAAGLNYAASFMILHTFHLILATKQPAMTAAHLAGILRQAKGQERLEEIADYAAKICRSQIAAALGNILLVALGAWAFVRLWSLAFGHPFLEKDSAVQVFRILSPLDSGTVFFAAWTGVILWSASVIGGWFDNWSVYHRLPDGIRDHRWGRVLGRERMARWGKAVRVNMGGWATNISLGLLLGLSPSIGAFLGIPLEVRHVTLSTGQLAFAASSLGPAWFDDGFFLRAAAGIAVMFALNLSVSFLCSLFTATRAYQLTARETAALLGHIIRAALSRPAAFLLPPRSTRT
jgi:site-specific recombinase